MTIDITKIKPGDRVAVWVEVCSDQPFSSGLLRVKNPRDVTLYVGSESIALHEPRPLAVGDRVRVKFTHSTGEVKSVCGNAAWFFRDGGSDTPYTVSVHDLERIP